jgi:DNA-binding CsgD family transcriptional regulator
MERTVIEHLVAGLTRREIAAVLGRHPDTVKATVKAAMKRYGAKTAVQLVAILVSRGEVAVSDLDALAPGSS